MQKLHETRSGLGSLLRDCGSRMNDGFAIMYTGDGLSVSIQPHLSPHAHSTSISRSLTLGMLIFTSPPHHMRRYLLCNCDGRREYFNAFCMNRYPQILSKSQRHCSLSGYTDSFPGQPRYHLNENNGGDQMVYGAQSRCRQNIWTFCHIMRDFDETTNPFLGTLKTSRDLARTELQ